MNENNLKKNIENYIPFDKQEIKDREYFIKWLNNFKDVLTRNNEFGHFTSSAFVVNEDRNKILLVYHNIFDGWIYPGGHADGEEDLLSVAVREVEEETGLKTKVLEDDIFAISSIAVAPHIKREKFISAHTHLDVVYLLEASDKEELSFRPDESQGVKWVSFEEIKEDELVSFFRSTYRKLVKKNIFKQILKLDINKNIF